MKNRNSGFAILTVMMMLVVIASLLSTYMIVSRTELALVKSSRDSATGFNAAEAGLNIRAEKIKDLFTDYQRPQGIAPSGIEGCDSGSIGTGDFACESYTFDNNHNAVSYLTEAPGSPVYTLIPPGQPFAGLNTQEYRYNVTSVGRNSDSSNEAILDLTFKSRLVPLFQFAIFFQEDLEFFNGAAMTVTGPVHTNGDLYLSPQTGGTTSLNNQTTVAGTFYRGQKSQNSCSGFQGTARAMNPSSYVDFPACSTNRATVTNVSSWNDNVMLGVKPVTVPSPEGMDSYSTGEYWQRADLRLVLQLTAAGLPDTAASTTGVQVVTTSGANIVAATNALHDGTSCPGLVSTGGTGARPIGTQGSGTAGNQLRLYREYQHDPVVNNFQRTLEVDMLALLNCIQRNPTIIGGKLLSDITEQGLVFHFTINGPNRAASHNNYSVRIRNGAVLESNLAGAAVVQGLTIVTDQGMVIWGNYNSVNATWKPSAIMADTVHLLSNSWVDADSYTTDTYTRDGSATTVQTAIISGIARTGGANGSTGQDQGADTNGGGVINIFRFNEWFRVGSSSIPDFTYSGSLVSLGAPRRSQSSWGPFTYYSAPNRAWSYDTRFNTSTNLPPMTPVFVYLQQELFVRDYEL